MEKDNNKISTQRDLGDILSETFRKITDAYNDHVIIEWSKINNDLYHGLFHINNKSYTMTVERISNNDWWYRGIIKNKNHIEENVNERLKIRKKILGTLDKNIESFFDVENPDRVIYKRITFEKSNISFLEIYEDNDEILCTETFGEYILITRKSFKEREELSDEIREIIERKHIKLSTAEWLKYTSLK